MKSFTSSLAFFAASVQAGTIYDSCPDFEVMQNFDLDRYLGEWRDFGHDKDISFQQDGGVCTTAIYSRNDDGSVRVRNNQYLEAWGEWDGTTGQAYEVDPEKKEGALKVQFKSWLPAGSYNVLDTDYDNYSIVYSCDGIGSWWNFEYLWILTRADNPTEKVIKEAQDRIRMHLPEYDLEGQFVYLP